MDNLRLVSVTGQTHHRGFLAGPQQAAVVAEGGHGRDGARYAVLATTAADDGPQLTHALARRLPLGHRAEAGALIVVKRQSLGRAQHRAPRRPGLAGEMGGEQVSIVEGGADREQHYAASPRRMWAWSS